MAKVIGVGGFFIKFKDPQGMRAWYKDVLGITTNDYGVLFEFDGNLKGCLQLGTFEHNTEYFGSPEQQYMLNFRVDNMEELKAHLENNNVKILSDIDSYEYGKFMHISDPEGNRLELWEPIDDGLNNEEGTTTLQR